MLTERIVNIGNYRVRYQVFEGGGNGGPDWQLDFPVDIVVICEALGHDPPEVIRQHRFEKLPSIPVSRATINSFQPLVRLSENQVAFAEYDQLVGLNAGTGTIQWRGHWGNGWIRELVVEPTTGKVVVRYPYRESSESEGKAANVCCISSVGELIWRAKFHGKATDPYARICAINASTVTLVTSHDFACTFELATGNLLERSQSK